MGTCMMFYNGAPLRTLKTPWLSSDLFLIDLLVDGRSGLVHGRKRTNYLLGRGLHSGARTLRIHQTTDITVDSRTCWCDVGVIRRKSHVFDHWCRFCIGVIRHAIEHRCRRSTSDGKFRCHVLDHWSWFIVHGSRCWSHIFGQDWRYRRFQEARDDSHYGRGWHNVISLNADRCPGLSLVVGVVTHGVIAMATVHRTYRWNARRRLSRLRLAGSSPSTNMSTAGFRNAKATKRGSHLNQTPTYQSSF